MKLNNTLIVTLPDFAKHFTFSEFWTNRRQFIRDMHPNKVYYWNDCLKDAYFTIVQWINQGETASIIEKNNGINALEILLGHKIDIDTIDFSNNKNNLKNPIIPVQAGQTIVLPEYTSEHPQPFKEDSLHLHKIEIHGKSSKPSTIKIGQSKSISLHTGEFTYVTAFNGLFVEFLPTHLQSSIYELTLFSQEGIFTSTLLVRNSFSNNQLSYKNVISIALSDDGYMFIDTHKKPFIVSSTINNLIFMLKYHKNAFYIKARNNNALILYCDGTLKTTQEIKDITQVISADIKENDHITFIQSK